MGGAVARATLLLVLIAGANLVPAWARQPSSTIAPAMTDAAKAPAPKLAPPSAPVAFPDVPGWAADDHAAAFSAFTASCRATIAKSTDPDMRAVCDAALAVPPKPSSAQARAFFEAHFAVYPAEKGDTPGLLTAYYEPVLQGRRSPQPGFQVPLHRRPADLVNLVDEADRASKPTSLTHARKTADGLQPFPTRHAIDEGALAGQRLELFYVADEVERFFLQIQGSGIVDLGDGTRVRVTYDGKNGHPYTSVGRYLIDQGIMGADQMSLQALGQWLRADANRGRHAIWQNKSYVFFREMPGATGPIGVMGVALTPQRSLAVDPAFHTLGLPIFVDAPAITHITGKPFRQLMIGQDVGSAIKGRQRGDIYAGSGDKAGAIAGITKQAGRFFVLLPKPRS